MKKPINISIVIPKVNSKFGAPMGRACVGKKPTNQKVYDRYVPMSCCGAYDKGGAYWGIGERLRVSFTADLSYIKFYRENDL